MAFQSEVLWQNEDVKASLKVRDFFSPGETNTNLLLDEFAHIRLLFLSCSFFFWINI